MLLKYFYDQNLAHASYMVGCQATGETIIVDPGRDIEIYLHEAEANDMQIVAVTETHIHADFVSGARELAERTGARLYLSDEGDENWKYSYLQPYDHQLLVDGDTFQIGNLSFEVMHTPGHTPEHISLLLTDHGGGADEPMGIFTGDFVFVGSIGRPDLLEKAAGIANTAESAARQMFHSLQRFRQLPDYLQVWPAHGAGSACGKGLGAIPSSTVGYEKRFNPAFVYDDEGQFVRYLLEDQPEPPRYFAVMKRVNKEGPRLLKDVAFPVHLPAMQLPTVLQDSKQVIDTRPAALFSEAFIPGAINIPASELSNWAGWLVDYESPLYLIVDSVAVRDVVRDLAYIGIDNIAGYFETTAIGALAEAGHRLQTYDAMGPEELSGRILNGEVTVVDIRNQTEWDEGHIPGARHIMLGYLAQRSEEIINGQPIVVQCRTGNRSAIGASLLLAQGAGEVINMQGGLRDWAQTGLPIEKQAK